MQSASQSVSDPGLSSSPEPPATPAPAPSPGLDAGAPACGCAQRFRQILDSQEEFHLVGMDGRIAECNRAFAASIGRTREETLGMRLSDIDPSPPERIGALIGQIMQTGSHRFRSQHRHKDGHVLDVEISAHVVATPGEPTTIAAFSHPIAEQLRRAQALFESEQKIRALFEHSSNLLCTLSPQGEILECNRAMRAYFGLAEDASTGGRLWDARYVGTDTALGERVRALVQAAAAEPVRAELELVTAAPAAGADRSATVTVIDLRIKPVRDAAGQTVLLIAEGSDISVLKRAEAERLRMQAQVIRAQEDTIRELSTPLIPLEAGIVVMPLVGRLDAVRMQQVIERLLLGVSAQRAQTVLLDITGVPGVDAEVAAALVRAAQAVRLLGAQVMLSGIRPEVAQMLVAIGTDLGPGQAVKTCSSLQSGLVLARRHPR